VHYNFERMINLNKIPNIISTKDLDYLKDIFEWNFNASKLAYHFSEQTINPIIKDMIMNVCRMHSEHCRKIKNLLSEEEYEQ